jgi:hypothetical protein
MAGAAAVPMLSAVQWEPFGAVRGWSWHLNSGTQAHLRVFDGSGRMVRYRLGASLRDLSYDAAGRITAYNCCRRPKTDQRQGLTPTEY